MARAVNPLLSRDASGTAGGIQFASRRGQRIIGRRSISSQPRKSRQLDARSDLAQVSRSWQALSDADRALWRHAADRPGHGFALYLQRTIPLVHLRQSPPSQPDSPILGYRAEYITLEPPVSPDFPIAFLTTDSPAYPFLITLRVAVVPPRARLPHPRKFTIADWADGIGQVFGWYPGWDWHGAWYEIRTYCLTSGLLLATDTAYIETA